MDSRQPKGRELEKTSPLTSRVLAASLTLVVAALATLATADDAAGVVFDNCLDDPPNGYVICATGTNGVPSSGVRTFHNPRYCHIMFQPSTNKIVGPGCWGPGDYNWHGLDLTGTGLGGTTVRHQVDNQATSGTTNARYEGFF
jgi:hypothetical protein